MLQRYFSSFFLFCVYKFWRKIFTVCPMLLTSAMQQTRNDNTCVQETPSDICPTYVRVDVSKANLYVIRNPSWRDISSEEEDVGPGGRKQNTYGMKWTLDSLFIPGFGEVCPISHDGPGYLGLSLGKSVRHVTPNVRLERNSKHKGQLRAVSWSMMRLEREKNLYSYYT